MADEFSFEIKEKLGVISTSKKGWSTELNIVAWGQNAPKYDLRSWDPEHQKMGKGVTLTKEEIIQLREILNKLSLD